MKEFNSSNLDDLRKDINAVLEIVAEQHGITLDIGNITYGPKRCWMKLTAVSGRSDDGTTLDQHQLAYNEMLDLEKRFSPKKKFLKLGETFISNGKIFTVVGWLPRSRKYPLIGINKAGTRYKFMADKAEKTNGFIQSQNSGRHDLF